MTKGGGFMSRTPQYAVRLLSMPSFASGRTHCSLPVAFALLLSRGRRFPAALCPLDRGPRPLLDIRRAQLDTRRVRNRERKGRGGFPPGSNSTPGPLSLLARAEDKGSDAMEDDPNGSI